MKRAGTPSPELIEQLEGIVIDRTDLLRSDVVALVDALLPVIASVDENAHGRGQTDRAPWIAAIEAARNASGPGLVALCRILDDDDTPPALREIARRFVEARLYRADRPRERKSDPSTSAVAAERARAGITRPGGKAHRVLAAYAEVAQAPGNYPGGATAREIEFVANVKAAHKRTSELLADGLLEVVTEQIGSGPMRQDRVRNGGRVLAITKDGREELARLNRLKRERDEYDRARAERRRKREERRQARENGVRSTS